MQSLTKAQDLAVQLRAALQEAAMEDDVNLGNAYGDVMGFVDDILIELAGFQDNRKGY